MPRTEDLYDAQNRTRVSGPNSQVVGITPGITYSAAYQPGQIVGGVMTHTNAVRTPNGSGLFNSLQVVDQSKQNAAFELLAFSQAPPTGSYPDKTAFVFFTADLPNFLGRVSVPASYQASLALSASYAAVLNVGMPVSAGGSQANLYYIAVVTGSAVWTSTQNLTFIPGVIPD